MPGLEGSKEVANLPAFVSRFPVWRTDIIDDSQGNTVAVAMFVVASGYVEDHASDVALDLIWRFKAIVCFQAQRTVSRGLELEICEPPSTKSFAERSVLTDLSAARRA